MEGYCVKGYDEQSLSAYDGHTMAHWYFLLGPPKHWMKIPGITMEWFYVDWYMSTNADCEYHVFLQK